jgi:hypothetical protein
VSLRKFSFRPRTQALQTIPKDAHHGALSRDLKNRPQCCSVTRHLCRESEIRLYLWRSRN